MSILADEELLIDEIFKGLERSPLVLIESSDGEWPLTAEVNGKFYGIQVTQFDPDEQ